MRASALLVAHPELQTICLAKPGHPGLRGPAVTPRTGAQPPRSNVGRWSNPSRRRTNETTSTCTGHVENPGCMCFLDSKCACYASVRPCALAKANCAHLLRGL